MKSLMCDRQSFRKNGKPFPALILQGLERFFPNYEKSLHSLRRGDVKQRQSVFNHGFYCGYKGKAGLADFRLVHKNNMLVIKRVICLGNGH